MANTKHTPEEIRWINVYFEMDRKMRKRDWLHLWLINIFDNDRFHRFYDCIIGGAEIKQAFKFSKIKEHEYIF